MPAIDSICGVDVMIGCAVKLVDLFMNNQDPGMESMARK